MSTWIVMTRLGAPVLATAAAAGAVGLVLLAAPSDAQTVPSADAGASVSGWAQRPKTAKKRCRSGRWGG